MSVLFKSAKVMVPSVISPVSTVVPKSAVKFVPVKVIPPEPVYVVSLSVVTKPASLVKSAKVTAV